MLINNLFIVSTYSFILRNVPIIFNFLYHRSSNLFHATIHENTITIIIYTYCFTVKCHSEKLFYSQYLTSEIKYTYIMLSKKLKSRGIKIKKNSFTLYLALYIAYSVYSCMFAYTPERRNENINLYKYLISSSGD